MQKEERNLKNEVIAAIIIICVIIPIIGMICQLREHLIRLEIEQNESKELKQELELVETEKKELEDEVIILQQRLEYFKDLSPTSLNMTDFFEDGIHS